MEAVLARRGYTIEEAVGKGTYGVVYRVVKGDFPYAAKTGEEVSLMIREYLLGKMLHHPNIIRPVEFILKKNKAIIIYPLAKGTLHKYEIDYFRMAKQILSALIYLEKCGLVYCDLKPPNVLVLSGNHVALCDLSTCVFYKEHHDKAFICASNGYGAPEIDDNCRCIPHPNLDTWAYGKLLKKLKPRNIDSSVIDHIVTLCLLPSEKRPPPSELLIEFLSDVTIYYPPIHETISSIDEWFAIERQIDEWLYSISEYFNITNTIVKYTISWLRIYYDRVKHVNMDTVKLITVCMYYIAYIYLIHDREIILIDMLALIDNISLSSFRQVVYEVLIIMHWSLPTIIAYDVSCDALCDKTKA